MRFRSSILFAAVHDIFLLFTTLFLLPLMGLLHFGTSPTLRLWAPKTPGTVLRPSVNALVCSVYATTNSNRQVGEHRRRRVTVGKMRAPPPVCDVIRLNFITCCCCSTRHHSVDVFIRTDLYSHVSVKRSWRRVSLRRPRKNKFVDVCGEKKRKKCLKKL